MTTRIWNGLTADWTTDADWSSGTPGANVPLPGDTAIIASGTVILTVDTGQNHLFENNKVTLGGAAGATLLLRDAQPTGAYFNVTITGAGTIEADGLRGFAGNITDNQNSATITLKADSGGELVLMNGASFNVSDQAVDFEGNVTLERDAIVSGAIVNNGTLSILSGVTHLGSSLTGTGTIEIGGYGMLALRGSVAASETISFEGVGGGFSLTNADVAGFSGSITNFAPGDSIDFYAGGHQVTGIVDAGAHVLTLTDDNGTSYVLHNFYGAAGTLAGPSVSNNFYHLTYRGAAPTLNYQIDAGARAMRADAAHAMTLPGTATPITGAGVKIGIISNSYNIGGNAAADVANGYLPAAGVTVLREGAAGDTDEGRAMAELIHQVAPGASLYFASTGTVIDDFASSVQALQAAGCTVIVDDISLIGSEPFFQLGSPAENAIATAITGGVTYVTSAGNYGDAYYDHAFSPTQQTLLDGATVQAMIFSNGTPYQSFRAFGGQYDQIDLQWDAPFYGTGATATDQPASVTFKVFDGATDALIGTSSQVSLGGKLVAESEIQLPFSYNSTDYRIAIYQTDTTLPISRIKYILSGASSGAGVGGRINDPDAGYGSGAIDGHQLVPGAIAVAAANVINTGAFGESPDFTEPFSSTGPGTLLFDATGNRLAQPVAAGSPDITGPDGIDTSVDGFAPFYGTSAAAPNVAGVAALLQQVNPALSPSSIAAILSQSALPVTGEPAATGGSGLVQADRAILLEEQVACYLAGTLILTESGEMPVEQLAIGEQVVTASGALRPIRWIGRRSYAERFLRGRANLQPVCFHAGSLADGVPRRDLWVSPQHAMLVDGLLVPAALLVNGTSIARAAKSDRVDYFHIELDTHDVILAEGALSETFLDDDCRGMFHNASAFAALYPGAPAVGPIYAPRVEDGYELEAIRVRLAGLAEAMARAA